MRKRVVGTSVLVVVGALVVWCASRWKAWFHNPDEAPYEAVATPSRVLLTFGDENGLNRNVSWTCGNEVCDAFVELLDETDSLFRKVKAEGEVFISRGGRSCYYVARLRGLDAGHSYRYRVWTGEESSPWYVFRLPEEDDHETSFLYVGDVQDSIGGIANQLLRRAFGRHPDAEFLVCGGDLTERPTDAFWNEVFEGLGSVGQTVPVLTVTGNHDYLKGPICVLERRFSLIHSYFLDSMVGENQVFTVRYKDVQLFCLDSNREFFYLWTQRQWLSKQLTASTAKWKVVVLHHPLYSTHGSTNNLIQRWMFDDLIQTHGVDLVLQGHEHAYARMTQHDEEGNATTPIYTVSHCSPKNYRIHFDERFDKFGSGSRYYQRIYTHGDTLFMVAYDAQEGTRYDSLYVVKTAAGTTLTDAGQEIQERITFTPASGNVKDAAFAERINNYKKRKNLR